MTSQPPVSPDSSVLLLRELDIPGRTGPVPSGEWGINIAAARDNFPRQGLQCRAGPWGNMDVGDLLRIFWGADNQLLQETIDEQEKNTELTLFIPTGQFTNGFVDVSYSVRRLGGVPEPSEVMKVFVKLTRPGGQDQNGDTPGHSELHMVIPKEILDGGIDKDNVAAGVPITIQPYPNMAVSDVIQVTWGGKFVLSAPLTQRQVEKLDPIVVHIDEATIRDAGDSDSSGLAAAFEVYDVVDNRSEDWCAEQRVVVGVDQTRLTAPIVKEAQNNVLDVDKLGDKDGTVQVLAVDNNFKLGDIIVLRVRGTPVEGPPIDLEIEGEPLSNVPSVAELKVPNALLKQLAKTQVVFSYRLKKANGSPDLQSKGQFIRVIGEIQRLKAPIAEDAQQGAIDPELSRTRIEIPFDKSFAAGQAIKLFWLGTRPDKSTYLPDLALRPISNGDIEAGESLFITVGGEHLATLKGGSLELYYQLLIEDSVLATFNRVNATHAIRESEHLAPLQVGEPRLELPEPKVDGVVNGALPADLPGTTLTVEYLNTVRDDVVTYEWVGSKTGKASDWITLNSFTAGKPVPFSIKAELIKGNEGGTVKASYSIKRAVGGETSYSNPLEFSVGAALVLSPPTVKEANGNSLNPIAAKDTLTIVVPKEVDLQPTDLLSVTWTGAAGTPAGGSHTTTPAPISSIGREIRIPVSVIAYNLGKAVTVSYSISRNGAAAHPSAPFLLNVSTLPAGELKASWILQADNDGEGPVLDLSKLTAGATVRSGVWPHIALGQFVWLDLEGTKADGSPHNKRLMFSPQSYVNQDWLNRGYYDVVGHSNYWKDLRDGSRLQVVFKAAFDKNANEDQATLFAVRTYTIRAALVLGPPTVKEANGNSLNPIAAKDTLTIVVPKEVDLQPTDLLSVTWTGAAGTPADGSHTTAAGQVGVIGREILVPVSVIAFNLGKPVTVKYTVTRGTGTPQDSLPFTLNVQALPASELLTSIPTLDGADNTNNVLNLTTLANSAKIRIAKWPHIAIGQKIWLRYFGTKVDGSAYTEQTYVGATLPSSGVPAGIFPDAPVAGLRGLKDGSSLRVEFKVTFDGSADESTAVTFPVRTFSVKAPITLVENFDGEAQKKLLHGQSYSFTTMTIVCTCNPPFGSTGQLNGGNILSHSTIAPAVQGVFEGNILMWGGGYAYTVYLIRLTLKSTSSKIRFAYATGQGHSSAVNVRLYGEGGNLLHSSTLPSFNQARWYEIAAIGIARIEFSQTGGTWFGLDNFQFVSER